MDEKKGGEHPQRVTLQRRTLSAVLAASMALMLPTGSAFADVRPDGTYDDVKQGSWYYESVMDATEKGLMSGYGGTYLFGPENTLLRAEMAAILANASGVESVEDDVDTTGLPDLKEPAWYTTSVNWAFAQGLIKGYDYPGQDWFGPNDVLTREQAMVVLHRWAEQRGADPNAYGDVAAGFPDWNDVSEYARESIEWAVERDIVDGTQFADSRTLDPQRPVLRSEMAKMIANAETVIQNGWLNVDTDGDGTPDLNVDTDGDGKPDLNVDADHDGKPELNVDTDGDGEPDLNVDVDGDGVPDVNIDTDGDGVADDAIDEDGDGVPDDEEKPSGGGTVRPPVDVDTDGDGIPDVNLDTDGDGRPEANVDTDGDGEPDIFLDADHDGKEDVDIDTSDPADGVPDIDLDTDQDGKADVNLDVDGDGKPDLNVDADGDGVADTNVDTDGDFRPDVNVDADGDGTPDVNVDTSVPPDGKPDLNVDADGDGKPDLNVDTDGDGDPDVNVDTDGDGEPDLNVDTSDPADNVPDINVDTDGDGVADTNIDTDGDRLPEVNLDTDGDGDVDIVLDADHDGREDPPEDTDADGEDDLNLDTDGDGSADVNVDVDGDKIPDVNVDTDGDGVADTNIDTDGDLKPDVNVDDDGDGTPDFNVTFDLPQTAHTDTTITVEPKVDGSFDVAWTLSKDGQPVDFSQFVDGTLNVGGGEITFKEPGAYTLVGTVSDGDGATTMHRETVTVYPVASVRVDVASMTHVDEQEDVGVVLTDADGLNVVWNVVKGTAAEGVPATPEQVTGLASLGNEGGNLAFVEPGTYTVTATVTDATGRSWTDSKSVTSYPVGQVGVTGPEFVHTDESLVVESFFDNLGDAVPVWSVTVDGQAKEWDEVFSGTLSETGGALKALVDGDVTITASFTDPAGREYEASCDVKVYPVPTVSYSLPADAWTDTEIPVTVAGTGLDDVTVEWLVDNTYGYQDWDTYVDGRLDNDGGTIRFKRAGTFEVVARVTDATGRTFLFEQAAATTVVQPVLDLTFDLPDETYVGDVHKLRTKGDNAWLPVAWTLEKDGQPAELADWMSGSLNALGGDIAFTAPGTYTLTATMTDVDGRDFTCSDTVIVHPNVEFGLTVDGSDGTGEGGNALLRKHLGEDFSVAVDSANVDGASVDWRIEDGEGAPLAWDDAVDGALGMDGGQIAIKAPAGDYRLVASVTDAFGKTTEHAIDVEAYNEAPSAPQVATAVDLYDSQSAFTPSATVKGTATPTSTDAWADDSFEYEWDQSMEVKGDSGYYGLGTHTGRVRAVDEWGAASAWTDVTVDVQMATPAAPSVVASVDYSDMVGSFTGDAKVKVAFQAVNNADAALTRVAMQTQDGYFGLGSQSATAVLTDVFGRTTEDVSQFEVVNEAPAAPSVEATVDYGDAQGAYTSAAKAKVTANATAGADRDQVRVEWADDSAATDAGAYLGAGSHTVKARTVDAFGAASDWATVAVDLGQVGKADPAGTVYKLPTASLTSSTLGSGDATASTSVNFAVESTGTTGVQVRTIDYYNQSDRFSGSAAAGSQSTAVNKTYSKGRHLLVTQVKDFFGNAAYGSKFFVVGSTTAGGGADIATQTTSIAEAGVFDGDTALAYIDSFTFNIPSISGHSSGNSDWIEVYGTKLDGSEVKLVHFDSNSGAATINASGGTARWTSDGSVKSGSFSYPAGTYVKLRFVYYNDHPGCLDNATQGLSYTVGYTFREDSGLEGNFDNLFDW